MNILFIENEFGSGQIFTVLEDFGNRVVERQLRPGENARIIVSQFKSVVVTERGILEH